VRGRTSIAVDDHLASGVADLRAVDVLRARGAARIVVAVPVGARESVALVSKEADAVVCPIIPYALLDLRRWYRDFSPRPTADVVPGRAFERMESAVSRG
jgi:putative phosphoribosyl transferase